MFARWFEIAQPASESSRNDRLPLSASATALKLRRENERTSAQNTFSLTRLGATSSFPHLPKTKRSIDKFKEEIKKTREQTIQIERGETRIASEQLRQRCADVRAKVVVGHIQREQRVVVAQTARNNAAKVESIHFVGVPTATTTTKTTKTNLKCCDVIEQRASERKVNV